MSKTSLPPEGEEIRGWEDLDKPVERTPKPRLDVREFGRQFKEFVDRSGGLSVIERDLAEKSPREELAKIVAENRMRLERLKERRRANEIVIEPRENIAFKESVQAAEQDKPLEAALERRHEIKDVHEDTTKEDELADSSSVGSILAQKKLSMNQANVFENTPQISQTQNNQPAPLGITYRLALYYGLRVGIVGGLIAVATFILLVK